MPHSYIYYEQKSNFKSSLKPWNTIEIIPLKKWKTDLLFFVAKTLKDITNHSLKLAKVYSQQPVPFKANASLYFNASQ